MKGASESHQASNRLSAEYESLRETVGLYADPSRVLLRVEGARAQQMMAGLVSNDLAAVNPPAALYSFVLTAKGRPLADPRIIVLEQSLLLDIASASEKSLREHFGLFLPPRFARLSSAGEFHCFSLIGPRSEEAARAALPFLADPNRLEPLGVITGSRESGPQVIVVRPEDLAGPGLDVYVLGDLGDLKAHLSAAVEKAHGSTVGAAAYEVWRIERGIPVYGPDIGQDNLPQETGQQDRAVSLSKGCYTGQEVVARIHYRGHVNRRLCGFRSRNGPMAPGEPLWDGDKQVGSITSAARSPRLGSIALGYLRRGVAPGSRLSPQPGEEALIEVAELPFPL